MTSTIAPIPTRPLCAKCHRYITVDVEADEGLWAEVVGDRFGVGYVCADCFTRAADERGVKWADRLGLVLYDLAGLRKLQATVAKAHPKPAREKPEIVVPPVESRDDVVFAIAALLKIARQKAGLSQLEVAQGVGISRAHVSNMEAGRYSFTVDKLEPFARVLGCSMKDLVP